MKEGDLVIGKQRILHNWTKYLKHLLKKTDDSGYAQ